MWDLEKNHLALILVWYRTKKIGAIQVNSN